jgi:hypothetical protein
MTSAEPGGSVVSNLGYAVAEAVSDAYIVWYITRNATSPSAEDRLTLSQRSVEEGFRLQRYQTTTQPGGRNPARVTVTSRRTAALDGRLLAAVRAWRQ